MKTKKQPEFDWSDPAKALATLRHLTGLHTQADQSDPDVSEESVDVLARDKFSLPLKVFRAAPSLSSATTHGEKPSGSPLIVLYFGGAFVLGNPIIMAPIARSLVKRFNAIVVAPTYRLAPEHPFPTGFEDGWDTLSWIAENASGVLRADPSKGFIVGGISAGGNISNIVTHLARDRALQPSITGVWLSCPGVRMAPKDADLLPEKYRERNLSRTQDECVNSVVTSPNMAKLAKVSLKPDPDSNLFAPMIWPTGSGECGHKGYPRTYSQVCGMDAARDEMLIFDDMLKNEGVPTRLEFYAGLPHCFWYPFKELPQSEKWEEKTLDGFAWLLDSSAT